MDKIKKSKDLRIANKELSVQNEVQAAELVIANKELTFQHKEKEKRAAQLVIADRELSFQHDEKEKRAAELIIANKELAFQNQEKKNRAAELAVAKRELILQNQSKEKRAAELIIADKELAFQNREKTNRADELIIADKELAFQHGEKKKRAAELIIANKELIFQNQEKEKRAAELIIANNNLVFQNQEKEERAAELIIANKELTFQNAEKEKRAAELIIANKELVFQNNEKEKRASELMIANKELDFQHREKEKRAAELVIANQELVFQNEEKEKRAIELITAIRNLGFQNEANRKCTEQLCTANNELILQNEEKEKRSAELLKSIIDNTEIRIQDAILKKQNKELEQFAYIASHDLQEPLRTVSNYMEAFEEEYSTLLDANATRYLVGVKKATNRMSTLIQSVLNFSQSGSSRKIVQVDFKKLVNDVLADLENLIKTSKAVIEITEMPEIEVCETEIRQVFQNLISNAIKFRKKGTAPRIQIRSEKLQDNWRFLISDNGIGISPENFGRVFDIFQCLNSNNEYEGCGIGLANCKRIVALHQGVINVESILGQGSTFYFTIPDGNRMSKMKKYVMLVDDDPEDNFFHQKAIKKSNPQNVIITRNTGTEALTYIKSETGKNNPLDLIFLDINMPIMNGWEFLQEYNLLDKEFQSRVIIIMLSTSQNPEDIARSKTWGFVSEFITKPLTEEKMNYIVNKYFK